MSISVNNPKRVYLDQNAWIALSREHYGKDPTHEHRDTLEAVRTAAASGRVLFPLSFNHLVEVCASGDLERRKRLARFMIDVSRKYAIAPFSTIRRYEALEAACRRFGVTAWAFERERLVQLGVWSAFGLSPQIAGGEPGAAEQLEIALNSDETAVKLLSEWMSVEAGQQLRKETESEAALFDSLRRSQLSTGAHDVKRTLDTIAVANSLLIPVAEQGLASLNADPDRLRRELSTEAAIIAFAHDVPTFDVHLSLALARDEDLGRPIDRNDLRDLGFLAVAIPYCDIVVAERFFAALAVKLKLDSKYGTRIEPSIRQLKAALEAI